MWYQCLSVRGHFLVKMGHYSKDITFRVMLLALQLHVHLVLMCKYSKFSVDNSNTFWATLKFSHNNDDDGNDKLAFTIT